MLCFSFKKTRTALQGIVGVGDPVRGTGNTPALGLRFYIEVARTAFRRQLIYRWANLAGLVTNAFWGAIISYLVIALFHARPVAAGYNVQDTLRYTWLAQAMIMIVLTFGWYDLMLTIRSGEVISDLSKPCDFYWYWFSRELGRDLYYLLFRGLPTYISGMLLFSIGVPGGSSLWLVFVVSFLLGAMLGIAYRFLYNVIAFWVIEARAVGGMAGAIALFFSGGYLAVAFFPPWLRAIADWLPFNGLLNVPAEIFLGKLSGGDLWLNLARQLFWLIVLTFVARLVAAAATRRVVVQGG
jgi:ABC-2 type transport system permease protein